jgi:hypothetical protein
MNGHVNTGLVAEVSKIVSFIRDWRGTTAATLFASASCGADRHDLLNVANSFIFTWLIARQNSTALSHLESLKSYTYMNVLQFSFGDHGFVVFFEFAS